MNFSLNREANKIRNKTMFKGCVHKDFNCNKTTSNAHSIQNNRFLDKIANNNGEVMCIDFGKLGLYGNLKLQKVGRKKASIFTGFCNYHDSSIFKPIEESEYEINNKEQEFLFAYRAFALSYYERHSSYGFINEHLEIKQKENHVDIEEFKEKVSFYKKHLSYIENMRIMMNKNLDNKKHYKISTEILN
ncbi:hypothetical protein D1872_107190 [compost metagenome]